MRKVNQYWNFGWMIKTRSNHIDFTKQDLLIKFKIHGKLIHIKLII